LNRGSRDGACRFCGPKFDITGRAPLVAAREHIMTTASNAWTDRATRAPFLSLIRRVWRAALWTLLALAARPVLAQDLPAAVSAVQCNELVQGQQTIVPDPVACSLTHTTASATLAPVAAVTAHGDYAAGLDNSAQANADLNYYFEVLGGQPGDVVPLIVATELSTSIVGSGSIAGASLQLHASATRFDQNAVACSGSSDACSTYPTVFAGTLAAAAVSGSLDNFIHLSVEAGGGDSLTAGSADASADPWIYVDPSFAGAANYRIVLSEGVANGLPVAAVPEPAEVALLAAGLAFLLPWSARRNRAAAGPAGS
jgi:hypothetical protein